jgi:hypothetical protein
MYALACSFSRHGGSPRSFATFLASPSTMPCGTNSESTSRVTLAASWAREVDDLRLLAGIVGVDSIEAALRVCADFFPGEELSPRSLAVLEELSG